MIITSILKKEYRQETGKSEWALVSKSNDRVLKWFGITKPSNESVLKEERRVQWFKHKGKYMDRKTILVKVAQKLTEEEKEKKRKELEKIEDGLSEILKKNYILDMNPDVYDKFVKLRNNSKNIKKDLNINPKNDFYNDHYINELINKELKKLDTNTVEKIKKNIAG